MSTKECLDCKQVFPISLFGANGKTETGKLKVKPRCGSCVQKYERRIFRAKLIEAIGGQENLKCVRCGYNKCEAALEFHHIDPKTKDRVVSLMKNYSFERLKTEIKKCILLCANCHRELHEQDGSINKHTRK